MAKRKQYTLPPDKPVGVRFRQRVVLTPGREVVRVYNDAGKLVATMDPVTRKRTPVEESGS